MSLKINKRPKDDNSDDEDDGDLMQRICDNMRSYYSYLNTPYDNLFSEFCEESMSWMLNMF